jgi:N-dimethylarginine dimethylaminohydrolase
MSTMASPLPGSAARARRRYLMCPPTYFGVQYAINPWMQPHRPVDAGRAQRQWRRLHAALVALGHEVALMPPRDGLPDLVFTANGGIVIGDRALVPRFRHPERAPESAEFAMAMAELGIGEVRQSEHVNEGEGDFLLFGDRILAGTGLRSDPAAVDEVAGYFGVPTIALRLVDPRFYHLDTALAHLDDTLAVYWPGAFDRHSLGLLRELLPDAVLADEDDAAALALNMVSDGRTVLMNAERVRLARQIAERGFEIVHVQTDELRKAGGGAKCCVLELHPELSRRG